MLPGASATTARPQPPRRRSAGAPGATAPARDAPPSMRPPGFAVLATTRHQEAAPAAGALTRRTAPVCRGIRCALATRRCRARCAATQPVPGRPPAESAPPQVRIANAEAEAEAEEAQPSALDVRKPATAARIRAVAVVQEHAHQLNHHPAHALEKQRVHVPARLRQTSATTPARAHAVAGAVLIANAQPRKGALGLEHVPRRHRRKHQVGTVRKRPWI